MKDHLGSTRMVLNENGGIKEALMYQPYGTVSDVDGMVDGSTDPLREKFTGKEYDEDGEDAANGVAGIEAYHFGFRMYDPEVGIWLAADPMRQYWNSYSYCGGNPINLVDIWGLKSKDDDDKLGAKVTPIYDLGEPNTGAIDLEIAELQLELWGENEPENEPDNESDNEWNDKGRELLNNPRLEANGNIQLNRRVLLGKTKKDHNIFIVGLALQGQMASDELAKYSSLINSYAYKNKISSSLVKGVITNEVVTRYFAGGAIGESILSFIFGKSGTYGPAQLGPEARKYSEKMSVLQAMTFRGAIIGASNWLGMERLRLTREGISSPTNGQIASRYNRGSISAGTVTTYGKRVEFIIGQFGY